MLEVRSDASNFLLEPGASSAPEPTPSSTPLTLLTDYAITHMQASESASIFFIEDNKTRKPLVAKVLRQFEDSRYHLGNPADRHRCQIEAFRHNCYFTPEVYIGLAKLHSRDIEDKHMTLEAIIEQPSLKDLEPEAEYALIMERLPDELRLDQLLQGDSSSFPHLLKYLTGHIVYLQKFGAKSLSEQECSYWGSYKTLKHKLEENLAFFSLIQEADSSFREITQSLSAGLRELFTEGSFARILEQRIKDGAIKHCHGDIKSLNIWIVPGDEPHGLSVKLLDAIDFNPLFNYIDVLSDFAMIVIDVWVRTQSDRYANCMIEEYFERIGYDDQDTRMLFEYYLIEKAIVAATINILFDNQRDLGLCFLYLAQERLQNLAVNQRYQFA